MSIIRETHVDLPEDIQSMVKPYTFTIIVVGRYIVQNEKTMVLDVPDLTGFKVDLILPPLCVVKAICCPFNSQGEIISLLLECYLF